MVKREPKATSLAVSEAASSKDSPHVEGCLPATGSNID